MAKKGQHHNEGLSSSKPRGHETSRGRNNPEKSEPIRTGTYKKPETYSQQAFAHQDTTSDRRRQATNFDPYNADIREHPDTATGSTRARDSDIAGGRSGSDSNADAGTRGH